MNLADPRVLRAFLDRHGLSARKGLGQHFLCSKSVVDAIVRRVADEQGILEIGPGPGVLTSTLSAAHPVIALELDSAMIMSLKESAPSADVRREDALEANLESVLAELPEPRAVVSNLPYYITGPLLTRIASVKSSFCRAVLMMQKEVGERICAREGTSARGSLSVFLQSQFKIMKVASVPAGAFLPAPKVDSVVLEFVPDPQLLAETDEKTFFRVVRQSFGQPRKTLANNLSSGLVRAKAQCEQWVAQADFEASIRPQQLSLQQWIKLSNIIGPEL